MFIHALSSLWLMNTGIERLDLRNIMERKHVIQSDANMFFLVSSESTLSCHW